MATIGDLDQNPVRMPNQPIPLAILMASVLSLSQPADLAAKEAGPKQATPTEANAAETPQRWFRDGALAARRARGEHAGSARNIILFLGDGMSLTTITAARIFEGQRNGASGEEHRLAFEEFPYTALSRTYEVDAQTPESAGTMSAIMTGIKTRFGVVGVTQNVRRGDCASSQGQAALSALELASAAGLATGIVTTTSITHATPAATYAHTPDRDWEFDSAMPDKARAAGCIDIARQFVEHAAHGQIDVAFGGGRRGFLPATMADPEYPQQHGKRSDDRDLIAQWNRIPDARFVWNATQFAALDPARPGPVLGLFEPEHLHYMHDRAADGAGEPTLAEMTAKAIALLKRDHDGFFLMIEGGRIDHAHHRGNAYRALEETVAFSDAVRAAATATDADDTLILVTADHSHTLTMAGYPKRGNPILGKVRGFDEDEPSAASLRRDGAGQSYTTLGYANGPGHLAASNRQPAGTKRFPHAPAHHDAAAVQRPDLDDVDTTEPDYLQESAVPMKDETHGGEDVVVFARGPGAEGVHGSFEQNVLFHLMVQANRPIRRLLCRRGDCSAGKVPDRLPAALTSTH